MTSDHNIRLVVFVRTLIVFAAASAFAGCATSPSDISKWYSLGGYDAVAHIEPSLYADDPALRQAAVDALLKMQGDPAALTALMGAMVSINPEIRGSIGATLLLNPDENLDFYSINLAADPDPSVRRQIAQGLVAAGRAGSMINTQRAAVYLWGLTQDPDADVRATAVEGVTSLGLNDPIDFALTALHHDPEPRVRVAAVRGLGVLAQAYLSGTKNPSTPVASPATILTQARNEEIVAALCQTARQDTGRYLDIQVDEFLLWTWRVNQTRWVASAAADALTIPNSTSRADVAAAIAAAHARPPPEPLPAPPAPAQIARPHLASPARHPQ
ncbi:MAG TPA: HEAT repeat domain-containing protein [Opitutales bacterium]|jgi:hypothetical protein|nr:HEAT repeat domain-containing protein [Opitutales bacterium]